MLDVDTRLVRAEALGGLEALFGGEEAGCRDVVVEFPVDERSCDDGYQPAEEEDSELVLVGCSHD